MAGSLHDVRVLILSTLWELVERGALYSVYTRNIGGITAGYYVLGDSAYPLQNWLLKPFPDDGRTTDLQQESVQGTGGGRKCFWKTQREVAVPYEEE